MPRTADINYFKDTQDAVFFNILPGVLVRYSETLAKVLVFVGIAIYATAVVLLAKQGRLNGKRVAVALAIVLATVIGAAVAGFAVSYLTALAVGHKWNLTNLRVTASGIPFACPIA